MRGHFGRKGNREDIYSFVFEYTERMSLFRQGRKKEECRP